MGVLFVKIGITYNLKQNTAGETPEDFFEEFDSIETIDALRDVFLRLGHEVVYLPWEQDLIDRIRFANPDFIFNIAEGVGGRNRESLLPSVLEWLEIPYSGSDPLTLGLTLDKAQAKILVSHAGIRTPEFVVIRDEEDLEKAVLPSFPLFVKPLWEGSSKGIRQSSRTETEEALRQQISWLWKEYGRIPLLIERFIRGREFTAGILGNRNPKVLGIMEIRGREKGDQDFFYSLEIKRDWRKQCEYVVPPVIKDGLREEIERSALHAFKALGCRDLSRVDFRMDEEENVYFLEANPLPGLSPVSGDIVLLAKGMGWSYDKLIGTVLDYALSRYKTISKLDPTIN